MKPTTSLPWAVGPLVTAEDAAYIVHSANAYPRLVAALTNVVDVHQNTKPGGGLVEYDEADRVEVRKEARALLTELGEPID